MTDRPSRTDRPAEHTWIFGYGSLVAPASLARTIGRTVRFGDDALVASLDGHGRRWNYGSETLRGDWTAPDGRRVHDGVVVSLGVEASDGETVNGVIVRLDSDELARLDWRERAYDRVEVTHLVTVLPGPTSAGRSGPGTESGAETHTGADADHGAGVDHADQRSDGAHVAVTPGPVEVYVPKPHAVERYVRHRDDGTAAVRRDYHDLVDAAFAVLGPRHHEWFRTTPPPDVPIVDVELRPPSDRPG